VKKDEVLESDVWVSILTGIVFASGLILSGMSRRTKILGFLTIADGWDPSLMFVMLAAVGVNFITFHYIINIR
jgi:hypothetical protein